jgi:arylsulfatase A-like enzyme
MIVALIVFTVFIMAQARAVPIISIRGNSVPAKAFPHARKVNPEPTVSTIRKCFRITRPRKKTGTPPTTFTKWAIDFLEEYKNEDKPYFLYVSYTAPHDPLHAWPEDIAKYESVYEKGYEAIRNARFKRQKDLGLFGPEAVPHQAFSQTLEFS